MSMINYFQLPDKVATWLQLMRADRPIGTYLLLWPTLMALWLAAGGPPTWQNLLIFTTGTFFMRSAGCVINDYFDRHVDGLVERTTNRPLATGAISERDALLLFAGLGLLSFILVLLTNKATVLLSFIAITVACCYPLMKRLTHMPQLVLGIAFSFGIPMAFAAENTELGSLTWLLFGANILWTIAYDTYYAMVDREDDLLIGIKSSAILFGSHDRLAIALLQLCTLALLLTLAAIANLHWPFYVGLSISALMFGYQQRIASTQQGKRYFDAFLQNNQVGLCWFVTLAADMALYPSPH